MLFKSRGSPLLPISTNGSGTYNNYRAGSRGANSSAWSQGFSHSATRSNKRKWSRSFIASFTWLTFSLVLVVSGYLFCLFKVEKTEMQCDDSECTFRITNGVHEHSQVLSRSWLIRSDMVRVKDGQVVDTTGMKKRELRKLGHSYQVVYRDPRVTDDWAAEARMQDPGQVAKDERLRRERLEAAAERRNGHVQANKGDAVNVGIAAPLEEAQKRAGEGKGSKVEEGRGRPFSNDQDAMLKEAMEVKELERKKRKERMGREAELEKAKEREKGGSGGGGGGGGSGGRGGGRGGGGGSGENVAGAAADAARRRREESDRYSERQHEKEMAMRAGGPHGQPHGQPPGHHRDQAFHPSELPPGMAVERDDLVKMKEKEDEEKRFVKEVRDGQPHGQPPGQGQQQFDPSELPPGMAIERDDLIKMKEQEDREKAKKEKEGKAQQGGNGDAKEADRVPAVDGGGGGADVALAGVGMDGVAAADVAKGKGASGEAAVQVQQPNPNPGEGGAGLVKEGGNQGDAAANGGGGGGGDGGKSADKQGQRGGENEFVVVDQKDVVGAGVDKGKEEGGSGLGLGSKKEEGGALAQGPQQDLAAPPQPMEIGGEDGGDPQSTSGERRQLMEDVRHIPDNLPDLAEMRRVAGLGLGEDLGRPPNPNGNPNRPGELSILMSSFDLGKVRAKTQRRLIDAYIQKREDELKLEEFKKWRPGPLWMMMIGGFSLFLSLMIGNFTNLNTSVGGAKSS